MPSVFLVLRKDMPLRGIFCNTYTPKKNTKYYINLTIRKRIIQRIKL